MPVTELEPCGNRQVVAWLKASFTYDACVGLWGYIEAERVQGDGHRWAFILMLLVSGGFSRDEALSNIPSGKHRALFDWEEVAHE